VQFWTIERRAAPAWICFPRRPFWPIRDGLPAVVPALTENLRCDVAVIGGGFRGRFAGGNWRRAASTPGARPPESATAARAAARACCNTNWTNRCTGWRGDSDGVCGAELSAGRDAIGGIERVVRRLRSTAASREASLLLASNRAHVAALGASSRRGRPHRLAVECGRARRVAAESTLPHPAAICSRDGAQVDAYRLAYALWRGPPQRKGARF